MKHHKTGGYITFFVQAVLTLAWHYHKSQLSTETIKLSQAMWRINFIYIIVFIFLFDFVLSHMDDGK